MNHNYQLLNDELKIYYDKLSVQFPHPPQKPDFQIWHELDEFAAMHPDYSAYQLKIRQYELIAETCEPFVFKNSPFFYELGLRPAWDDGAHTGVGTWLRRRNTHFYHDCNPVLEGEISKMAACNLILSYGLYFDVDHHVFPFCNVIENGLEHYYLQAQKELKNVENPNEAEFLQCATAGLLAAKKIAEKFAQKAQYILDSEELTSEQREFMTMIAVCARRVPWKKPETFYEGLASLWFLRDTAATLEGVGMHSHGAPDRVLYPLYKHDLDKGIITQNEAKDLITRFLLMGSGHYDPEIQKDGNPNYEITYSVGGCDAEGNELFNDLTEMFIAAQNEHKMIYPRPHARYSASSSKKYLDMINSDFLNGRSVWNVLNDDVIIAAAVKHGYSLADARKSVLPGCWGWHAEGNEPGGGVGYFNLLRILEFSLYDDQEILRGTGVRFASFAEATDAESLYRIYWKNVAATIEKLCTGCREIGAAAEQVNPEPFYSAALNDCLLKRRDATAGGARYNPQEFGVMSFANTVDSLIAINELCFVRKRLTLPELIHAMSMNWQGFENIRREILTLPHFGDNTEVSNRVAERIHNDLYAETRRYRNARNGQYRLSYWVYVEYIKWGKLMRATPDGRYCGDSLAQGISPSQQYPASPITDVLQSIARLDLTKCGSTAVWYVNLPLKGMSLDAMESFERVTAQMKGPTLQPNCVSEEELRDAQIHPEKHQGIVVRVCGFSAKFTALCKDWQNEFIKRNIYR